MALALVWVGALIMDRLLGEPRPLHPLTGFGQLARYLEIGCYGPAVLAGGWRRLLGGLSVLLLVVPLALLAGALAAVPYLGWAVELLLLYGALGMNRLRRQAEAVAQALVAVDLPQARAQIAQFDSRDTAEMDEEAASLATVERVLTGSRSALFGVLFWFLLAGAPGLVAYRLVTVLAECWGHPTPRYRHYGWAAARLEGLLGWLPAQLTAFSYSLLGRYRLAWRDWQAQGRAWQNSNDGVVLAAGGGALCLQLGGTVSYFGRTVARPPLGAGLLPRGEDIGRALRLLYGTLGLWTGLVLLVTVVIEVGSATV